MNIRVMRPSDIPAVRALWYDTPGMGMSDEDDSPQAISRFIDRNPNTCFIAEDGDTDRTAPVGCVLCGHDGRRATIYHLAVRPDHRRAGIGQALVNACMDASRSEGITKARLYVFESNTAGNAFWDAIGFTARDDLVLRNKMII